MTNSNKIITYARGVSVSKAEHQFDRGMNAGKNNRSASAFRKSKKCGMEVRQIAASVIS